ncbi:MAG: SMI1/KNR4 family protein [Aquisalinus sp.]|nr:SMI1/KNR4 family protein [Aquisalinus sp.]
MFSKLIGALGGESYEHSDVSLRSTDDIESLLGSKISLKYIDLLKEYKSSIIFKFGAVFKPIDSTPLDDSNGLLSLEMLYGLAGSANLFDKNEQYKNFIPREFIVIGDSFSDNQICIKKESGEVFFWNHEARTEEKNLYKISKNISKFLYSIKPEEKIINIERIGVESSNFNF